MMDASNNLIVFLIVWTLSYEGHCFPPSKSNGVWGSWTAFSNCRADCSKIRTRECNTPKHTCLGSKEEIQQCPETYCVVQSQLYNQGDSYIVGGRTAKPNEVPFQVGIRTFYSPEIICGGSLISEWYVLTAAHCTYDKFYTPYDLTELRVVVGEHDYSRRNDGEAYYNLSSIKRHPKYNNSINWEDDIALLMLDEKVYLSKKVQVIALSNDSQTNLDGKVLKVSGWGNNAAGYKSHVLKTAKLMGVPKHECRETWNFSDNLFCAKNLLKNDAVCHGDSGGPITIRKDEMEVQVGITVGGSKNCSSTIPQLFINVGQYLEWITAISYEGNKINSFFEEYYNATRYPGENPLHQAALKGNINVVKFLCNEGDDIEVKDTHGFTPLHHASMNGKLDVVKFLFEKGANIEAKDGDGWTPLHFASMNGELDVVKFLCEKGANIEAKSVYGRTPIHLASYDDKLSVIKFLCEKGANIEAKDGDGETPLHLASNYGKLNVVRFLCEKGANIKAKSKYGSTHLHIASRYGNFDVVMFLYEKGVDIEAKDVNGRTPLHHAAGNGNSDVVMFLCEKGVDIEAKDGNGSTSLHLASEYGKLDVVIFLCENGANIDAKDRNGRTPLHYASKYGKLDVVIFLCEKGANIEAKDGYGETPLHIASLNGYLNVVKFLYEKGSNIEAKDIIGQTPLHSASFYGKLDVVIFLCEKGANIEAKDIYGKNPVDLASSSSYWRNLEVKKFFCEKKGKCHTK